MQEGRKLFLSPTLPFGEFTPSHVHASIHPSIHPVSLSPPALWSRAWKEQCGKCLALFINK